MTSVEELIAPLRHSPRLIEAAALLNRQIDEEKSRRHRFYAEMTPEQKIEFIDGEVVLHSPTKNRHLHATLLLARLLGAYVDLRQLGAVKVEKCLCVFPRNDYEPDLVYFGRDKAAEIGPDTLRFPVPDLVVEVLSDTTEARDRGVKFEDYAAHGVAEYWIVDAETESVEQYLAGGSGFELRAKAQSGDLVSEAIPGLSFPVRAIFDETENLAVLRKWLSDG